MKKIVLLLTIAFSCFTYVKAQVNATTHDGKRVILNNDGSWSAVEEKNEDVGFINCSQFTTTEEVESGSRMVSKSVINIKGMEDKAVNISIREEKSHQGIGIHVEVMGAGDCLDDNSMMNVKLRTGNTIYLENDAEDNCERRFSIYLGKSHGNHEILEIFRTLEVGAITMWTNDGMVKVTLTPVQSKQILNTFHCMLK